MLRGLEASAKGMLVQEHLHEAIAQNLANVSTTGYRRQVTTFHTFADTLAQQTTALPVAGSPLADTGMPMTAASLPLAALHAPPMTINRLDSVISSDDTAGETHATGNLTDLALHGDGYFTVQGPNGPLYTRNGTFRLDAQHQLVTEQGYPLQGEQGPVVINGKSWTVNPTGAVLVDGVEVNTLKLAALNAQAATRQGTSLWSSATTQPAGVTRVEQGALEGSNVNAIHEMVSLIQATRHFEANMRCLQAQDSTLEHAVNELGRV